jgi:uncharacterized protein YkuJ
MHKKNMLDETYNYCQGREKYRFDKIELITTREK